MFARQVTDIIAAGFPAQQVLLQLQSALLADSELLDGQKAGALSVIAASDKRLVDGGDEYLQLLNVACQAQQCLLAAA